MNNFLEQIMTRENIVFGSIMIGIFGWSMRKISKNPKEISTLPNLVAALGIIGTFYGISMGLLHFDTNNINESIPKLLDGMKTAFGTSLVGLVLSNFLKSYQSHKRKSLESKLEKNLEDISLEKIAILMVEMKESIVLSNKELVESIVEMKNNNKQVSEENREMTKYLVESLIGEKESTLVSQMRTLRENMVEAQNLAQEKLNTGLEKMGNQLDNLVQTNNAISSEIERGNGVLIEEFRTFAKNMSENNMKAFTEAIQKCIKDLNNQLQEQFGENFKHLNLAVEKLLDWQINYKETIEKATENQIEIYKGIEKAKTLLNEISEKSLSIVEVTNKLGDKIVTFDTQQQNLTRSIEVLNKVSVEAKDLLPNLDSYMVQIKNKTLATTENMGEITKISTDNIKKQHLESTEALKNITDSLKSASDLNIKAIEEQISGIEKAVARLENEGFTLTKKISDNIQVMVKDNNSNLETSIKNINNLLSATLNTSLQSLGEQLAAVSEKFVSDYTPLTIELQKVVNIAKRVGQ